MTQTIKNQVSNQGELKFLYIGQLFAYSFVTVDSTEILCMPKRSLSKVSCLVCLHFLYVSCLFIKHHFTCSLITIGSTEILCMPKRSSFIARHFISSTFFCESAVCLLISQNINKKLIEILATKVVPMEKSTVFHKY